MQPHSLVTALFLLACSATCFAALCPLHPSPVDFDASQDPGLQAALAQADQYLRNQSRKVPSLSVSIVYDQQILLEQGYGNADVATKKPATKDTLYRIGSVSKTFITLMMFQAQDLNRISIDDEINHYIHPKLRLKDPFATSRSTTFRQLASHLAGLPREAPCLSIIGLCNYTTHEIFHKLNNMYYKFPPDSNPSYSNVGFAILAHALGQIRHRNWIDLLQHTVLNPLGMNHTGAYPNAAQQPFAATAYLGGLLPLPWYDLGWEGPAGQLFSSAHDMATYLMLHFRNNLSLFERPDQLLDGHTINTYLNDPAFIDDDALTSWGYPWEMSYDPQIQYWPRGKGGSVLGFTSQILLFPPIKLGITVLINSDGGNPSPLTVARDLSHIIVPALEQALRNRQSPPPLPPVNVTNYVGYFTAALSSFSATANVTQFEENGNTRLRLVVKVIFNSVIPIPYLPTMNLNYDEFSGAFLMVYPSSFDPPTCDGLQGGIDHEMVVFTPDYNSFTIPGLLPDVVFNRH